MCVCKVLTWNLSAPFFLTSTLLNTIRLAKRDAVLCVLGNLPASELLVPTFRNFLSVSIFLGVCFFGFMLIFLEMNLLLLAQRIILVGVGKSRLSLQMLRDVQFLFQEAGLPFNPFLHHFLRFYENRWWRTGDVFSEQVTPAPRKRHLTTKTAPALHHLYQDPPLSHPPPSDWLQSTLSQTFPVFIPLNSNPVYHFYALRLCRWNG